MIIIRIAFAIVAFFANTNANVNTNIDTTQYIEFRNVRDSTNDYANLRITYELCAQINRNEHDYEQCAQRAFNRAISIDT